MLTSAKKFNTVILTYIENGFSTHHVLANIPYNNGNLVAYKDNMSRSLAHVRNIANNLAARIMMTTDDGNENKRIIRELGFLLSTKCPFHSTANMLIIFETDNVLIVIAGQDVYISAIYTAMRNNNFYDNIIHRNLNADLRNFRKNLKKPGDKNAYFANFMKSFTVAKLEKLLNDIESTPSANPNYFGLITLLNFFLTLRRAMEKYFGNFRDASRVAINDAIAILSQVQVTRPAAKLTRVIYNLVKNMRSVLTFANRVNFDFEPRMLTNEKHYTVRSLARVDNMQMKPSAQQFVDVLPLNDTRALIPIDQPSYLGRAVFDIVPPIPQLANFNYVEHLPVLYALQAPPFNPALIAECVQLIDDYAVLEELDPDLNDLCSALLLYRHVNNDICLVAGMPEGVEEAFKAICKVLD